MHLRLQLLALLFLGFPRRCTEVRDILDEGSFLTRFQKIGFGKGREVFPLENKIPRRFKNAERAGEADGLRFRD